MPFQWLSVVSRACVATKWKLARVIATYPGNDGLVRKARIKTQDSEYHRPIHKLCLIATKDELNADRSSYSIVEMDTNTIF